MKSVLISIKPKWCEFIAIGKKTIEVRKTKPRIDTPFKCYIYETKTKDFYSVLHETTMGKVIGEFVCDKMLPIAILAHLMVNTLDCMRACLSAEEIIEYAAGNSYVYGWHISDLKIYDKPKELSEFRIKRPPQSWCYVEEEEK